MTKVRGVDHPAASLISCNNVPDERGAPSAPSGMSSDPQRRGEVR